MLKTRHILFIFLFWFALGHPACAENEGRNLAVKSNAEAGRRVALVIGNGDYQNPDSLPKLANPTHDAEDMASALRGFGFEVIERKNQTKREMDEAIVEFSRKIGNSDAALFYFAGHGIQVKGQNYLIPVDANIETEAKVPYVSINVNRILDEMDYAGSKANIVMLDACRNNPISGKFRSGASRGLAAPASMPKGTVIVYATDPGNIAKDGDGRNGLFTSGLLRAFKGHDLSLHGVLVQASKVVEQASAGMQTPYVNGPAILQEEFHFGPDSQLESPAAAPESTRLRTQEEIERDAWFVARDSQSEAGIREYLRQYPEGRYVGEAKVLLATLGKETRPEPASVPGAATRREDAQSVLWSEVQKGNAREDYRAYLEQYPKGRYAVLAKARIKKLEEEARAASERQENAAWQAALSENSEESYGRYLNEYPRGQFRGLATARISKFSKIREQAAIQGESEFAKGVQYENGIGVSLSRTEALARYRKAAEIGHPGGLGAVAAFTYNGWAGSRDFAKACGLAKRAALAGDSRGMNIMALCYEYGLAGARSAEDALQWFKRSAAAGNADAMYFLGGVYKAGLPGVERNIDEANKWYLAASSALKVAAENGIVRSMGSLGALYQHGLGVQKNAAEAVRWYKKGASTGSPEIMSMLANMYLNGEGVERNVDEAFRLYKQAAEKENVNGMYMLGAMYFMGRGVAKSLDEAANWFKKAADVYRQSPDDPYAMTMLGLMYQNGLGVEKSIEEAARWYKKGSEAGNSGAMVSLSYLYSQGLGVEKNIGEAVRLTKMAAELENSAAMNHLGWLYQSGIGVDKSLPDALRWYRKGAEAGEGDAMVNLGVMYENGMGVDKNNDEALRWYRKGVELENPHAMNALSAMYLNGKGVELSYEEGVRWARKAAGLGSAAAMANLGWAYEYGKGVEQNKEKAIEWYRKSSALGNDYATAQLKRLGQLP